MTIDQAAEVDMGTDQASGRGTDVGARAAADSGANSGAARSVHGRIEIDTGIDRVWRALTEAAELQRWFPLQARVEPGEGGSMWMSWQNEYAGASRILAWEPPHLLRTTWGEVDGHGAAQVTEYQLESAGERRTVVRVVTSGFPSDAAWDDWVEGTRLGWRFQLRSLKQYLERHDGLDRRVVYLRRRVALPPEVAWSRILGDERPQLGALRGTVIDDEPGRHWVAELDQPDGAMLLVSLEPCYHDPSDDRRDVTIFLSAWGEGAERVDALQADWRALLERLYPRGETV